MFRILTGEQDPKPSVSLGALKTIPVKGNKGLSLESQVQQNLANFRKAEHTAKMHTIDGPVFWLANKWHSNSAAAAENYTCWQTAQSKT